MRGGEVNSGGCKFELLYNQITMGRLKLSIGLFFLLTIFPSCTYSHEKTSDVLSGNYWKPQALNDIMPFWTEYARDEKSGAFFTNLDSLWLPFGSQNKYPSMTSRHLFSYSVAYLLTGNRDHLKSAKILAGKINKFGVLHEKEVWLTTVGRTSSEKHGANTYWWVQAYGNIFNLYLYHVLGESRYLDGFQKGAGFWDPCFMDKKHGDTYFSVDTAGRPNDRTKATRFKTSYHSIEHCLLKMKILRFLKW